MVTHKRKNFDIKYSFTELLSRVEINSLKILKNRQNNFYLFYSLNVSFRGENFLAKSRLLGTEEQSYESEWVCRTGTGFWGTFLNFQSVPLK